MVHVFLLWHSYVKESGEDEAKLVGVYSTEGNAKEALLMVRGQPGFRDHPKGFEIVGYTVDKSNWLEGFGVPHGDSD